MPGPSLKGILNHHVLGWAREASRLDHATVAKRLKITEEKLQSWESGDALPTLTQLRKLAAMYKRSVGVFFLDEVPRNAPQPADFRRLELSVQHLMSPDLATAIRAAEAKRDAALEIYDQWEAEPPKFELSVPHDVPADTTAEYLARQLGITMQHRRGWATEYEALNGWKSAIESKGVLVMQVSGVDVSEMRGCSIALFPLPIILLNSSDRPLGRVFSLIHEMAHLIRAESGLCDVTEEAHRHNAEQAVEVYCNRVAGAVLVPTDELLRQPAVARAGGAVDWAGDDLVTLRRTFWASREAILRRLLIVGRTTRRFYEVERERMRRQYAFDEGGKSAGFVPFSRKVVLANGRFLTGLVVDAYDSHVITGSDVSRILGTKLDHLPKILNVLRGDQREAA